MAKVFFVCWLVLRILAKLGKVCVFLKNGKTHTSLQI